MAKTPRTTKPAPDATASQSIASPESAKAPPAASRPRKGQRIPGTGEDEKKQAPDANGGKSGKSETTPVGWKKALEPDWKGMKDLAGKKAPAKGEAAEKAKRAKPSRQAEPKVKARIGAPPKYKPEYVAMVEKMAILGLTDAQMAGVFGVTTTTFANWKVQYPAFLEANARGKVDPNRQVEQSLFRMALGGFTIKKTIRDADGNVEKIIEEERPGDVAAATKWLFNRDPERWREKVEIEHSGAVDMTRLTPEEFERRSKEILTAYLATLDAKKPDAT